MRKCVTCFEVQIFLCILGEHHVRSALLLVICFHLSFNVIVILAEQLKIV